MTTFDQYMDRPSGVRVIAVKTGDLNRWEILCAPATPRLELYPNPAVLETLTLKEFSKKLYLYFRGYYVITFEYPDKGAAKGENRKWIKETHTLADLILEARAFLQEYSLEEESET